MLKIPADSERRTEYRADSALRPDRRRADR
ncbi:Uncharacterised protein [Rikenella microfusus]|uniref:Uncharacterized protein n=1 Tax=Rikenella microfusus TaxID=28139 RepID=A0A379MVR3_9BACT|nr:Uncharacterised protein [Rikenella microfusus]